MILPLTGPVGFLGEAERNAILMAEQEINNRGGIHSRQVDAIIEDSKSSAKDGLSAFHKLKAQGVKLFLVSMTAVAKTVSPIADREQLLQVALSADPFIAEEGKYTFRTYYGLDLEIRKMVDHIQSLGGKRVAALYINTPEVFNAVTKTLPNALEKIGAELIITEPFSFTTKDVRSLVAKIASKKPNWVIVEDYGSIYPNIIKEASALGIKNTLIGGIGFLGIPPDQRVLAGGIVFVAPKAAIERTKEYDGFIGRYKSKYGKEPPVPIDAIHAYDSFNIIMAGCKKGGDRPVEVRKALLEQKIFEGAIGKIILDENGKADFETGLGIYKNGELRPWVKQ